MKKTSKKRLALEREIVKVLAELPRTEFRHMAGGGTEPDNGCAGNTIKTINTTLETDCCHIP